MSSGSPDLAQRSRCSIKIDMPHSIELYSDGWPPIGRQNCWRRDRASNRRSLSRKGEVERWGIVELTRRQLEEREQRRKPPPVKTVWARGSMEWLAEQEKARPAVAPDPPDIE